MKKLLYLIPSVLFMVSCGEAQKTEETTEPQTEEAVVEEAEIQVYPYHAGTDFDQSTAISKDELAEVVKTFDGNKMELAFTTEILENCEKKGCWMTVDAGEEEIRVSFKDYDFFVPLDSKGHETTLNGVLFYDTLSVDELRHYAMDANATQDSLDQITEPIITLSYEATGVYVQ